MAETHSQPVRAADRGALKRLQHCTVRSFTGGLLTPEVLHVHTLNTVIAGTYYCEEWSQKCSPRCLAADTASLPQFICQLEKTWHKQLFCAGKTGHQS